MVIPLAQCNAAVQVRDWYVESFRELRGFPKVKDAGDELQFTRLLQHIYRRHTNVVPVMAMGVAGAAGCIPPCVVLLSAVLLLLSLLLLPLLPLLLPGMVC